MHPTAYDNARDFFFTYAKDFSINSTVKVVDIGAQNVNGSLKEVCPSQFTYIGVDFQEADDVDVVLKDPYILPFENESIDIVVSSSCFEHSEMFWITFLEILRVLKPGGLFYLNAPSAGSFHRYPVDCWRFYPDSGSALVAWGSRNGYSSCILESFTQKGGDWNDFVCVFLKDESTIANHLNRISSHKDDFENGKIFGSNDLFNFSAASQHEHELLRIKEETSSQLSSLMDALSQKESQLSSLMDALSQKESQLSSLMDEFRYVRISVAKLNDLLNQRDALIDFGGIRLQGA